MTTTDPILPLLKQAFPSPARLKQGTDAVILSLHCLMVNDGFRSLEPSTDKPIKGFTPPSNWNRQHQDEWVITYTRENAARRFRLHCSLQAATDRLFVHACELADNGEPVSDNIQVMGLQLGNYVNMEGYKTSPWEDIIKNERTLTEMFTEFVLSPLWHLAEKGEPYTNGYHTSLTGGASTLQSYANKLKFGGNETSSLLKNPYVLTIGVAAVAAGALIWYKPTIWTSSS